MVYIGAVWRGFVAHHESAEGQRCIEDVRRADCGCYQAYKADHNDDLFKSSSANVRAGTLARASKERDALLTLAAGTDVKPVAAAASSSSSGVMQVAMSPTPAIPATSAVQPLFTMPRQEAQMPSKNTTVAQDVSDRKVAHIVTGGLGGSLA
jgi:hypothetical protein